MGISLPELQHHMQTNHNIKCDVGVCFIRVFLL